MLMAYGLFPTTGFGQKVEWRPENHNGLQQFRFEISEHADPASLSNDEQAESARRSQDLAMRFTGRKQPTWSYLWYFGDGHYSFGDTVRHFYSNRFATNYPEVVVHAMPVNSRALPKSHRLDDPFIQLRRYRTSREKSYPEVWSGNAKQRIKIVSNASNHLVPGYQYQFIIHYRIPNRTRQKESAILAFAFNEWEDQSPFKNLSPFTLKGSPEIFGGNQIEAYEANAKNGSMITELQRKYQDIQFFKLELQGAGNRQEFIEGRLFLSLEASLQLNRYLKEKGRKKAEEVSVMAAFIPENRSLYRQPNIFKDEYKLKLNLAVDPNNR